MGTRDERVDEYLSRQADFARPLLEHMRELVHEACPDIEETIKWGVPSFEYHGLLCHMAGFKAHCAFGFWKHAQVFGVVGKADRAMGSFGRITTKKDLPTKREFKQLMKKAVELNEKGIKGVREKGKSQRKAPVALHPDFEKALAKSKKARAFLDGLAPSYRRDYLEWIDDAKREATRAKRIGQAIEWLKEGKRRNWKYENC